MKYTLLIYLSSPLYLTSVKTTKCTNLKLKKLETFRLEIKCFIRKNNILEITSQITVKNKNKMIV